LQSHRGSFEFSSSGFQDSRFLRRTWLSVTLQTAAGVRHWRPAQRGPAAPQRPSRPFARIAILTTQHARPQAIQSLKAARCQALRPMLSSDPHNSLYNIFRYGAGTIWRLWRAAKLNGRQMSCCLMN